MNTTPQKFNETMQKVNELISSLGGDIHYAVLAGRAFDEIDKGATCIILHGSGHSLANLQARFYDEDKSYHDLLNAAMGAKRSRKVVIADEDLTKEENAAADEWENDIERTTKKLTKNSATFLLIAGKKVSEDVLTAVCKIGGKDEELKVLLTDAFASSDHLSDLVAKCLFEAMLRTVEAEAFLGEKKKKKVAGNRDN